MKKRRHEREAAFVMEPGDRFHSITVSDPIRFERQPTAESVIAFFFILRRDGTCDAVNVHRIFDHGRCVSRTVQTKNGIPPESMRTAVAHTLSMFAGGIAKETGYLIRWNTLDLSDVEDRAEQIRRIRAWGRLGVRTAAELGFPTGRN